MHNYLLTILFLSILFLSGCDTKYPNASSRRQSDEAKAETYLTEAREALKNGDIESAKIQIKYLRGSCRYALEAREQAILLMDSIEIFTTSRELQEMDSAIRAIDIQQLTQEQKDKYNDLFQQVKFYQRKLQHDKQQRKHYD